MYGTEQETSSTRPRRGISGVEAGLFASFLLGWAPILGKLAYRADVDPITLASMRTLMAAILLWMVTLLVWRQRVRLPVRGLMSCLLVGAVNGIGSLFYYSGLDRLGASQAALLGALYPVWVVIYLSASGQTIQATTLLQLAASMVGAVLVTSPWRMGSATDILGAILMVASAAVNGWYIVMGQWVLADVPSQSGTLYIMTGMAATVLGVQIMGGQLSVAGVSSPGWVAIAALGLTTALSRMAMFFSLETLGGVQTAILSLVELAISLALAFMFLGDRLYWYQWMGAALLLSGGLSARIGTEAELAGKAFDPIAASEARHPGAD